MGKKKPPERLTKKDLAELQAYQAAIREWKTREPQGAKKYTPEVWADLQAFEKMTDEEREAQRAADAALPPSKTWKELGYTSFQEYANDPKRWRNLGSMYSEAWEAWNAEGVEINRKYDPVIIKALTLALSERRLEGDLTSVSEILERITAQTTEAKGLLLQQYLPMLNGYPTNDLMAMSTRGLEADGFTNTATYTRNGRTITIHNYNDLVGAVGVSAKKVMDTATAYLTLGNYYRGSSVNPTATIPLMEYWRAQGLPVDPHPMETEAAQKKELARAAEYVKWLKKALKADLDNLKSLEWSGQGTGKNRGDFAKGYFVSSYRVKGDTLYVNFDIDIAKYLVQAYVMQWSPALLRHSNQDPNGYVIGRKLLLQHSMDSNAAAGTENTLSVKTLLEEAPEITTIEELTAKGRRDWKKQIKEKLEMALERNRTTAPLLSRWEYRDPATGTRYTPETASALTWDEYSRLMVDFTLAEEPDQTTRRTARAAEKAAAQDEQPTKKRGRPRKKDGTA